MKIQMIRTTFLALVCVCGWLGLAGTVHAATFHVPRDFDSIQEAVDAALPGDRIKVARGTYGENVLITTPNIRLLGRHAVIDGTDLGGIGIHVLGTSGVRIQGFTVQGFEAGIVLEGASRSRVHRNISRSNFSDATTLRDGLQLVDSHLNVVTRNVFHGNGHNGITLKAASSRNLILGNTSNDNGVQVVANFGGCGVQLIAADNDHNLIAGNQTLRNGWGIQVGGGSDGNAIVHNQSHANARAGVVVLAPGMDNFVGQNKAEGNGLANVAPSGMFDLFDQDVLDNTWRNNRGTFNH